MSVEGLFGVALGACCLWAWKAKERAVEERRARTPQTGGMGGSWMGEATGEGARRGGWGRVFVSPKGVGKEGRTLFLETEGGRKEGWLPRPRG